MSQTNAMQRIKNSPNLYQHRFTGGGARGTSTVTDGRSRKPHPTFAQWSQSEGAKTESNMTNDEKYGTEHYSINGVPKDVDTNSTSSLTTPTKQKDGTFNATLMSDVVKPSNQAVFHCKELTFPPSSTASKK